MSPMRPSPPARTQRARLVVLAVLLTNVGWVIALPVLLIRPPTPAAAILLGVLLAVLATTYVFLFRAAVTPWVAQRTRTGLLVAVLAATLALLPVGARWAEPTQEPWAWLAGFAAGVGPLVLGWRAAVALGTGVAAVAVLGAVLSGQSVLQTLVITVGIAVAVIAMGQVAVWLLRLLVAAEAGREAEANLAVSQERLRFARDLHDVLGHRLGLIALQAEVVGSEQIRELATTTLQEVRAAVHGYGTVDLAEQLETARLVLTSAGIEARVDADPVDLDPAASQLVAATVREAVTNLLRHSQPQQASLTLTNEAGTVTLVIMNDGLPTAPAPARAGLGLAGLADRAAQAGARLRTGVVGDRFEVRLELAAR
jgi:two-component system, NarL family, sensor histidine kinase DesK